MSLSVMPPGGWASGTTGGRGLQREGSSLSAELSTFLRERSKWSMPVGGENAFTNALL